MRTGWSRATLGALLLGMASLAACGGGGAESPFGDRTADAGEDEATPTRTAQGDPTTVSATQATERPSTTRTTTPRATVTPTAPASPAARWVTSLCSYTRDFGTISAKFSEDLNLKFTGVTVTGPGKTKVKTDNAMLMGGDKTFMVNLPEGLPSGTYHVDWHALSRDGHKTHGSYTFTVKP